jgi:ABC-type lipoprotein release transport system permease subunit
MSINFRLAWRNLWRQPRRTWLTAGAMIFSNALIVFMISVQFGMYRMMIDNTLRSFSGHIQLQAPGYNDDQKMRQIVPDVAELAEQLRTELQLDSVSARGIGFALVSSVERSAPAQIIGVEPDTESLVSNMPGLVSKGRYLADRNAPEVVIGSVLARNLRVDIGDELTLLGNGPDGSFAAAIPTITGIIDSAIPDIDRTLLHIPLGFFQDTFSMGNAGHSVVIMAPEFTAIEHYRRQTAAVLEGRDDLVVLDWDALNPGLREALLADFVSAWLLYGVLIVLVAFSVLNTQLMSVLERTKEFGIILSLGLTPGRLGRLVILEAALMGLLGLVLGVLLGGAVAWYFSIYGFSLPGMDDIASKFNMPDRIYADVSPLSLLLGPTIVYVATLMAALYPALRLHWLRPVDAMRAV